MKNFFSCPFLGYLAVTFFSRACILESSQLTNYDTLDLNAIIFPDSCDPSSCSEVEGSNKRDGIVFDLLYGYGPCAPQWDGALPTLAHKINADVRRIGMKYSKFQNRITGSDHMSLHLSSDKEVTKIPIVPSLPFSTMEPLAKVGFGKPKVPLTLSMDTANDLTWIQCAPCTNETCYDQTESLYDPQRSSTYSNMSCDVKDCSSFLNGTVTSIGCTGTACTYNLEYKDGSKEEGVLGKDTLSLSEDKAILDFKFGCGHNSTTETFGTTGGNLGLGRGNASIVIQTEHVYSRTFEYCLPETLCSFGYLQFGLNHDDDTSAIKYTPLLTKEEIPSSYCVGLEGITVAGEKLDLDPFIFSEEGAFIDPGTVLSYIHQTAYTALSTAFQSKMKDYPRAEDYGPVDTCYNFTGFHSVTIPAIGLVFAGLHGGTEFEIKLDPSGILDPIDGEKQVCLAFSPVLGKWPSIIGNMAVKRLGILHDIPQAAIGFKAGAC